MRTFLQGCHVSAGCDGTWQDCLVFMIILWIWRDHVRPWLACGTHTLFFSLGIVALWWDVLGDGCVGVGGLLHFLRNTMYNGFGCEQDWGLTPTPMSPVQLQQHVKSHIWFVQKTWPIYESTASSPLQWLDGLFSLLWLACVPKLCAWTPTLAIENIIYIYIWYVSFFFQRPQTSHFCGCCTVRLNLQDVLLWYFPKC